MFELAKQNLTEISLFIGGIFSFFAGRKSKKNGDIAGELENIEKVRNIEKTLLSDMEEQIAKLMSNSDRLEEIVERQIRKIRQYEVKYGFLKN